MTCTGASPLIARGDFIVISLTLEGYLFEQENKPSAREASVAKEF